MRGHIASRFVYFQHQNSEINYKISIIKIRDRNNYIVSYLSAYSNLRIPFKKINDGNFFTRLLFFYLLKYTNAVQNMGWKRTVIVAIKRI